MILENPQINEIPKNAIILSNTKAVNLIQKCISSTAKQHKGEPMPNPITRINLNFDQFTGKAEFKLFDKNKDSNELEVDINSIHEIILSHRKLYGIVDLSSLSFSSLGISIISKSKIFAVEWPAYKDELSVNQDCFDLNRLI